MASDTVDQRIRSATVPCGCGHHRSLDFPELGDPAPHDESQPGSRGFSFFPPSHPLITRTSKHLSGCFTSSSLFHVHQSGDNTCRPAVVLRRAVTPGLSLSATRSPSLGSSPDDVNMTSGAQATRPCRSGRSHSAPSIEPRQCRAYLRPALPHYFKHDRPSSWSSCPPPIHGARHVTLHQQYCPVNPPPSSYPYDHLRRWVPVHLSRRRD